LLLVNIHLKIKNAYNDQQNPLVIAKEFAEDFDISSFAQQHQLTRR